tara:strand:- start:33 stop:1055 length:1023 start_codon:yes stop_codon:yes gene_type:complete
MHKTALITGITGQDGAYLAELLIKKNYKVIGALRRSARQDNWRLKRLKIEKKIIFEELELSEENEINRLFKKYKFKEVYNLAAQSFVATSFNSPLNTSNITGLGVLRILEAIRTYSPKSKFFQASSSEMFGQTYEKRQNEESKFNPQSPYAISKLYGHYITQNYRKSYNLYATSGIAFNHESPLRGEEFVTRKITKGLISIMNGELKVLELGNLDAKRDWGYAKEYALAMWQMLQQKKPDDFILSTGKTYTIKNFIDECVKYLKMETIWVGKNLKLRLIDKKTNRNLIKINKKYFRPAEVDYLRGNSKKANKSLKWRAKTNLKRLVKIMIDDEIKYFTKK